MKRFKQLLLKFPEYLLIAAVIFYWGSTGVVMNLVAIVLIVVLILQLIFQNRIIGLLVSSLIIMGCLYMLLALISELNEFQTFNAEARKLLFVGLSYFISIMFVAGLMINKYSKTKTESSEALSMHKKTRC
jgi:hypothetical protein